MSCNYCLKKHSSKMWLVLCFMVQQFGETAFCGVLCSVVLRKK